MTFDPTLPTKKLYALLGPDCPDELQEEILYELEQRERDEALRDWTEHDRSAAASERIDNVLREK